jgi:hypothetical protein
MSDADHVSINVALNVYFYTSRSSSSSLRPQHTFIGYRIYCFLVPVQLIVSSVDPSLLTSKHEMK